MRISRKNLQRLIENYFLNENKKVVTDEIERKINNIFSGDNRYTTVKNAAKISDDNSLSFAYMQKNASYIYNTNSIKGLKSRHATFIKNNALASLFKDFLEKFDKGIDFLKAGNIEEAKKINEDLKLRNNLTGDINLYRILDGAFVHITKYDDHNKHGKTIIRNLNAAYEAANKLHKSYEVIVADLEKSDDVPDTPVSDDTTADLSNNSNLEPAADEDNLNSLIREKILDIFGSQNKITLHMSFQVLEEHKNTLEKLKINSDKNMFLNVDQFSEYELIKQGDSIMVRDIESNDQEDFLDLINRAAIPDDTIMKFINDADAAYMSHQDFLASVDANTQEEQEKEGNFIPQTVMKLNAPLNLGGSTTTKITHISKNVNGSYSYWGKKAGGTTEELQFFEKDDDAASNIDGFINQSSNGKVLNNNELKDFLKFLRDEEQSDADTDAADIGGADIGGADIGGADTNDGDIGGSDTNDGDQRDDRGGGGVTNRGANNRRVNSWPTYNAALRDMGVNEVTIGKIKTGFEELEDAGKVSDANFSTWVKFYYATLADQKTLKSIDRPGAKNISPLDILKVYDIIMGRGSDADIGDADIGDADIGGADNKGVIEKVKEKLNSVTKDAKTDENAKKKRFQLLQQLKRDKPKEYNVYRKTVNNIASKKVESNKFSKKNLLNHREIEKPRNVKKRIDKYLELIDKLKKDPENPLIQLKIYKTGVNYYLHRSTSKQDKSGEFTGFRPTDINTDSFLITHLDKKGKIKHVAYYPNGEIDAERKANNIIKGFKNGDDYQRSMAETLVVVKASDQASGMKKAGKHFNVAPADVDIFSIGGKETTGKTLDGKYVYIFAKKAGAKQLKESLSRGALYRKHYYGRY